MKRAIPPVPVDVGEGEPRTGVRAFLAQDQPRPAGPAGQVDQAGHLGDPGAVAQFRTVAAVGVDRRGRALLGDQVTIWLILVSTGKPKENPTPRSRQGCPGAARRPAPRRWRPRGSGKHSSGWKPKRALPGRRGVLLLRMRAPDHRVEGPAQLRCSARARHRPPTPEPGLAPAPGRPPLR